MSIDVSTYRHLMGRFATGVTVVGTSVDGWLHGMTANAVTSVSLDPLLLLVCVDKKAHTCRQLAKAGRFAVSILSAEQEEIAHVFAAPGKPQKGRLRGVPFHMGPNGTPVVKGCLAYLECAVVDRYAAGDHTIFIGEVLHGEMILEAPPLLFYRAAYWRAGLQ